jgi:predicted CXXCH cytochrome family protein
VNNPSQRLLLFVLVLSCGASHAESIVYSVHNLSASGPGTIKAATESDVCVFCHTVHSANGATPLWNHSFSSVSNYIVYTSTTLDELGLTIPQPNGASRLCLGCHDGTVALGSVSSRTTTIEMQQNGAGIGTMPAGAANLGTDLSGDHPISFVYDSALAAKDPRIKDPSVLKTGPVRLDEYSRLQCTACHDPHNNQFGNFLVADNTTSGLCLTCHAIQNWAGSAHAMTGELATSAATAASSTKSLQVPGSRSSPAASLRTGAKLGASVLPPGSCGSCHVPHLAGGKQQLMRFAAPEQNCLPCHSGGKSGIKDVAADFQKSSAHPLTQNREAHTPNENVVNPSVRHVTCADCHNPHSATFTPPGGRSSVVRKQREVAGVNAAGAVMPTVANDYELCFRCHADSHARGPARVTRQYQETNTRLQFAATSSSFHPVETPGRNENVPSLLVPWTSFSTITCTDCHNSDQGPGTGGSGANGPHGSRWAPILERQLVLNDYYTESPGNEALCYKCHSRDSILGDQSFKATNLQGQDRGHRFHVVDAQAACTTCHDSHASVYAPHLMNFNTMYVKPTSSGQPLQYVSTGVFSGNCTLSCHDQTGRQFDHLATPYGESALTRRMNRGRGIGKSPVRHN